MLKKFGDVPIDGFIDLENNDEKVLCKQCGKPMNTVLVDNDDVNLVCSCTHPEILESSNDSRNTD